MKASMDKVGGIVLAGGKSSRMGTDKALITFRGRALVEHMSELLRQAGCMSVHISGDVPGYNGIPDAVRHDGPARAMVDLLRRFDGIYKRLLFVPVDMPLIEINLLLHLVNQNGNAYYSNYPLPACLKTGEFSSASSVKEILASMGAKALVLPPEWEGGMANINTPKEWDEVA